MLNRYAIHKYYTVVFLTGWVIDGMEAGDHKGLCEMSGILQAMATLGSKYSLCNKNDYCKVIDSSFEPLERSVVQTENILDINLTIIREKKHGTVGLAKQSLKDHGLAAVKSPLWDLPVYKKNFFQRMGICGSHLLALGVVKRLFLYTAWILREESLRGTDDLVGSGALFSHILAAVNINLYWLTLSESGLKTLSEGIYRLGRTGKFRGIAMEFLTAEDIESALQVAVPAFSRFLARFVAPPVLYSSSTAF